MRPESACSVWLFLVASLASPAQAGIVASQAIITQGSRLSLDVSPVNEQLAIELAGGIWLLPRTGGPAKLLAKTALPASEPRWSPDGGRIVFESGAGNVRRLWQIDLDTREPRRISNGDDFEGDASWHPDGQRIVFSSNREGSLDLWERDLSNGLAWRITHHAGEETDPAWSADGRDLAYILNDRGQWMLMLRRFGQPDTELLRSAKPLASPSWRPDGTLLTYLQQTDGGLELRMAILSNPPLFRSLAPVDAYATTPVSWLDRGRMYYSAGGRIKTRRFDDWSANSVAFRATVEQPPARAALQIANRNLPSITPGMSQLVIRSGRLFDGLGPGYREGIDVRIENGLIAEVVPRQDWGNLTVIDLSGTTLLPGLIDVYSSLPKVPNEQSAAALLSWGITTLVSPDATQENALSWEGEQTPGPRLLRAEHVPQAYEPTASANPNVYLWTLPPYVDALHPSAKVLLALQGSGRPVMAEDGINGLTLEAAALLGTELLPPLLAPTANPVDLPAARPPPAIMVSSLAGRRDVGTPKLYAARQARLLRRPAPTASLQPALPDLRAASNRIVVGSKPSGLPAGLALHAELRQLAAAGLANDQVLKAAGYNSARLLGLTGLLGEVSPGAKADLLLVNGDPLGNVDDLLNVVAVVRNGRFYSAIALLDRVSSTVE